MHVVGGIPLDANWFLQFIFTLFLLAFALLYLVKNTASKYFEVHANFDNHQPSSSSAAMASDSDPSSCPVCAKAATSRCSGCKSVRYCSLDCQRKHWRSGHQAKCKARSSEREKTKKVSGIALVPSSGTSMIIKKPTKVLFPYEDFLKLFNWDKAGFPPCGLLNCGNSCFANVVLQCLVSTRPLVAYLLEKGHRRECRRNDRCFFCEFQTHVERAIQSPQPFSPINILSRLPNIGGNLGYGRQEDAHEFMRFAIDTMQSVCLDEFGGEKAVDPSCQETTLIQHIFGGHLQSQVICTQCNKISNQYENMMDLTVEIHGDASSLEECLDQFTVKERLDGENMYKCDGCNDYVKAWKRLTIKRAPNVLTIALKRFQSGRFGKLNKRVSFPETLDLTPYMSEGGDGTDVYRLYAVVVHVDMLNASFFGHYICYTKDFRGNWYRIDDDKVESVELEEVLSQGAYMLLYSRVSARPTCLRPAAAETDGGEQKTVNSEAELSPNGAESTALTSSISDSKLCNASLQCEVSRFGRLESPNQLNTQVVRGVEELNDGDNPPKHETSSLLSNGVSSANDSDTSCQSNGVSVRQAAAAGNGIVAEDGEDSGRGRSDESNPSGGSNGVLRYPEEDTEMVDVESVSEDSGVMCEEEMDVAKSCVSKSMQADTTKSKSSSIYSWERTSPNLESSLVENGGTEESVVVGGGDRQ